MHEADSADATVAEISQRSRESRIGLSQSHVPEAYVSRELLRAVLSPPKFVSRGNHPEPIVCDLREKSRDEKSGAGVAGGG